MTATFRIIIYPILVETREVNPIVAVYLTDDIRSGYIINDVESSSSISFKNTSICMSEIYYKRITRGTSKKITDANLFIHGSRYGNKQYKAPTIVLNSITLPMKNFTITTDSAVCIQMFCEVACGTTEWGCHTCGWTCACILDLLNNAKKTTMRLPLCDQGWSEIGARGIVDIELLSTSSAISFHSSTLPYIPPLFPTKVRLSGITSPVLQQYAKEIDALYSTLTVTNRHIRLFKQPNYISCGGCMVRPPCAFLLNKDIPKTKEEIYLEILAIVLRRRSRCLKGLYAEDAIVQNFIDGHFDANENGAILMDFAMAFSNACTYLFDEVMKREGNGLAVGEDFSRYLPVMLTGDCEDFSHHALSILWEVLRKKDWKSPAMIRLQNIRRQYAATIILKSVTKPSVSSWNASNEDFAAHDCCDLVPLELLSLMLTKAGSKKEALIIDEIAKKRRISYNGDLIVIVGEGTGRVLSHIHNESDPSLSSSSDRDHVMYYLSSVLPNVGSPVFEDYRKDSVFYLYALTAYIHDTLIENDRNRWPIPQVIFLDIQKGTIGAPHASYVVGNARALAVPEPSTEVLQTMMLMEKFEFPSEAIFSPYEYNWIQNSPVLRNRIPKLLKALNYETSRLFEEVDQQQQLSSTSIFHIGELCKNKNNTKRLVEINVPFCDLTDNAIQSLQTMMSSIENSLQVEDVVLENFAPGLATVAIIFSIK